MKLFKLKVLKKIVVYLTIVIGLLFIAYLAFTNLYPSFGGDVTEKRALLYQQSQQYKDGKFNNKKAVPKELTFTETLKLAYYFFTTEVPNGRPKEDLKVVKVDSSSIANYTGDARLIWLGHSSFLLQMQGKTILLDPMFGEVAAPHPLLGEARFNEEFPLEISKLPTIDAVIFSHDHYDHLDYETILEIKEKTSKFIVPLGLGVHLEAWGVSADKICELDWWQELNYDNITIACTPAQHFSGRKLNNGQSTLWSSWVLKSENENIYFSGDSGYASHFAEIGAKYGPFDIALLECGQYNLKWADIHMMPEETALAAVDLKAKKAMPIHWAGFKLALHDWTDPIIRVKAKAKELNLNLVTPRIGEQIIIKDSIIENRNWWENL